MTLLRDALGRILGWPLTEDVGGDREKAKHAQESLERALVRGLGRKLPGVSGYGARWDRSLGGMALGVFVDPENASAVQRILPEQIDDFPVRVIPRKPPRAQKAQKAVTAG